MRLLPLTAALLIGLAPALHAQETQKTFSAQGATESAACEAAQKQARDWARRGKSEGRARALLDDGRCECTASQAAQACTLDIRVSEVQHEEEEER